MSEPLRSGTAVRQAVWAGRAASRARLHRGDPATLDILRTKAPDWGEPLACGPDRVSLYWGCGLTALAALLGCGVPWFATHAPGRMLVTDRQDCAA